MAVDSDLDLECLNPIFDPALVGIGIPKKPIVRWSEPENLALKNCIKESKTESKSTTSEELSLMMLACGWRRTSRQIRDRMRKLADVPTAGKVKWTTTERALMVSVVETEKKRKGPVRWFKVRAELAACGYYRTSKQIRERYVNLDCRRRCKADGDRHTSGLERDSKEVLPDPLPERNQEPVSHHTSKKAVPAASRATFY